MVSTLALLALARPGCRTFEATESPAAVLDRFIGRWKTEALIRSHAPTVREIRTVGARCAAARSKVDTSSSGPPASIRRARPSCRS